MFSLIWILCNNALKSEQVLKKFGVEKFDPINEKFDPSRHRAIFQIPDPSKPPGTVASVVKVQHILKHVVLIYACLHTNC